MLLLFFLPASSFLIWVHGFIGAISIIFTYMYAVAAIYYLTCYRSSLVHVYILSFIHCTINDMLDNVPQLCQSYVDGVVLLCELVKALLYWFDYDLIHRMLSKRICHFGQASVWKFRLLKKLLLCEFQFVHVVTKWCLTACLGLP